MDATIFDAHSIEATALHDVETRDRLDSAKLRPQLIEAKAQFPFPASGMAVTGFWEIVTANVLWSPVWEADVPHLSHPAIVAVIPIITDAATSVSWRVTLQGDGIPTGSVQSNILSKPGSTSTVVELDWIHEQPLYNGDVQIVVETIVTAGPGLSKTFAPFIVLADPETCRAGGGNWVG